MKKKSLKSEKIEIVYVFLSKIAPQNRPKLDLVFLGHKNQNPSRISRLSPCKIQLGHTKVVNVFPYKVIPSWILYS